MLLLLLLMSLVDVKRWALAGRREVGEGRKELSPKYHIYQFYNKLSSSYPPAQL